VTISLSRFNLDHITRLRDLQVASRLRRPTGPVKLPPEERVTLPVRPVPTAVVRPASVAPSSPTVKVENVNPRVNAAPVAALKPTVDARSTGPVRNDLVNELV